MRKKDKRLASSTHAIKRNKEGEGERNGEEDKNTRRQLPRSPHTISTSSSAATTVVLFREEIAPWCALDSFSRRFISAIFFWIFCFFRQSVQNFEDDPGGSEAEHFDDEHVFCKAQYSL